MVRVRIRVKLRVRVRVRVRVRDGTWVSWGKFGLRAEAGLSFRCGQRWGL